MACDCFLGLYSVKDLLHLYVGAAVECSCFAFFCSVQSAGLAGRLGFCLNDKTVAAQWSETEIRSGGTKYCSYGCIDCRTKVQRCRVANEVHLCSLHKCGTLQEGQFSAKVFRILISTKTYDVFALCSIIPAAEKKDLGFRIFLCHERKQLNPLFLAHCLGFPKRTGRNAVVFGRLSMVFCRFFKIFFRRVEAWLGGAFAPYIRKQRDVAFDFMHALFNPVRLGFGEEK